MTHKLARIVLALSCLVLALTQRSAAAPAPDVLPALLAQGLAGLSFSPDGSKVLVSMNAGGVYNAYAVPAAGGAPEPLTHSTAYPVFIETYFPHDNRFLFRSRKAEGEPEHLFVRELDGKETDLSPGKGSRFKGWNADGTSFLLDEDQRGSGVDNVYEVSTQPGYARKFVFQNTPKTPFAFASPDRRYLVTTRVPFDLSREIYIKDTRTDSTRGLFSGEAQSLHLPVDFTPDGNHLLLLFDGGAKELLYLAQVDIGTGVFKRLVTRDWDVLAGAYSPDHKLVALTVAGDASSHLELYDAASFQRIALPDVPLDGSLSAMAFSPDSKTLAFLQSSSAAPPEILAVDVTKPGPPRKLIQGGRPEISSPLVAGQVVRFASWDKTEIPGILFQPPGAGPGHKMPAVIWVHDGPSRQTRLDFDPFLQYLLSRGYAVYAINHRGSSGYGKSFQRLDNGRHGDVDLRDCLAAKTVLEGTGWVDPQRIAIAGEGHGGFLALAAMSLHPQELAAGISFFGVLDWGRYLGSLRQSDPRRGLLYEELGELSNTGFWQRVSPAYHASAVVRPVLLVQGGNDTVAIPQEAQSFVAAVKAKGVPAEEVLLPGEGHEFSSTGAQVTAYRAAADFLDRNLKKPEPPPKAGKKK
ncbi:MAG: prolyl oligopeptidase family serine peptidase [Thermoanaerobaculia bacterium]